MKKITLILTCLVLFVVTFLGTAGLQFWNIKRKQSVANAQPTPTPSLSTPAPTQPVTLSDLPPKQSLVGKIADSVGDVERSLLQQEGNVEATPEADIFEGEGVTTGTNSKVILSFNGAELITVPSESDITLASTNPAHFLVQQTLGAANYSTSQSVKEISVRSLHLLTTIIDGKGTIDVDPDEEIITFTLEEGSGKMGYIDTDNNTQMVEVQEGERITFDDERRTFRRR